MLRDSGKRRDRPEDDLLLLQQIREADPSAGGQFLEYLVLQRRSTVGLCYLFVALTILLNCVYASLRSCICNSHRRVLISCSLVSKTSLLLNCGERKVSSCLYHYYLLLIQSLYQLLRMPRVEATLPFYLISPRQHQNLNINALD